MAPDGLHTIEAPPTGNCTHEEAYAVTGDKITLIGNVQYDLFRSLTPGQMKQEVRNVVREVNGRRFILSPSAGPYEQVISPQMVANYMAFLDAAAEF
jgi:uroporphyrinogen-III decarboxylase